MYQRETCTPKLTAALSAQPLHGTSLRSTTDERMRKVCMYAMHVTQQRKEGSLTICDYTDGPGQHCAQSSESEKDRCPGCHICVEWEEVRFTKAEGRLVETGWEMQRQWSKAQTPS